MGHSIDILWLLTTVRLTTYVKYKKRGTSQYDTDFLLIPKLREGPVTLSVLVHVANTNVPT